MDSGRYPLSLQKKYCFFCPKMCRFSCPVGVISGRESWAPGWMVSYAKLAEEKRLSWKEVESAIFACLGCYQCRDYCAHDNDVPLLLQHARREIWKQNGQGAPSLEPLPHTEEQYLYSCQGEDWGQSWQHLKVRTGPCYSHFWSLGALSQEELGALILAEKVYFTSSECAFWLRHLGLRRENLFYAHQLSLYEAMAEKVKSLPKPCFVYLTCWEVLLEPSLPPLPEGVAFLKGTPLLGVGFGWPETKPNWSERLNSVATERILAQGFRSGVVACEKAYRTLSKHLNLPLHFLPHLLDGEVSG